MSTFPLKSANSRRTTDHVTKIESEEKTNVGGNDTSAPATNSLPSKKTFKENIINFWTSLLRDYGDVFKEAYEEGKAKPLKSAMYLCLFGAIGYAVWSNPTEADFYNEYLEDRAMIAGLGSPIRNPKSEEYLLDLGKLMVKGELRYQSLGLFSVVWKHDEDKSVGIFDATCPYVKPILTEFRERFLDIGFAGRWWVLSRSMIEYDVNEREWELAEHLKEETAHNLPVQAQVS